MEAFRLADTETTEIRTFGSFSEIVFQNRRPTDFCSLRPVTAIKAIHYFTGFTFRFQTRSSSHHPHKFIAVTEDGRSTDHTGMPPCPAVSIHHAGIEDRPCSIDGTTALPVTCTRDDNIINDAASSIRTVRSTPLFRQQGRAAVPLFSRLGQTGNAVFSENPYTSQAFLFASGQYRSGGDCSDKLRKAKPTLTGKQSGEARKRPLPVRNRRSPP